jgi:hypothetical protein
VSAVYRRRPGQQPFGWSLQDQQGKGHGGYDGGESRHEWPDPSDSPLHLRRLPLQTLLELYLCFGESLPELEQPPAAEN